MTGTTQTVRILSGSTHFGKQAVYITGSPEGLRHLAELLRDLAESPGENGSFIKFERGQENYAFATDDSVDVFEIHCAEHPPQPH